MKLKPIQPKGLAAQFKAAPDAVQRGMREAAEAAKADFEQTVATWKHQPSFTIQPDGAAGFMVGTDDEIYRYVDEGTKPHVIVVKRARFLRFAPGGQPKTSPGRLTSAPGAAGNGAVFRKRVNHPGTKARLFTQQLAQRWQRGVQPYIRAALEETFR